MGSGLAPACAPAAQAVPGHPDRQPTAGRRVARAHGRHNLVQVPHRADVEAAVHAHRARACRSRRRERRAARRTSADATMMYELCLDTR